MPLVEVVFELRELHLVDGREVRLQEGDVQVFYAQEEVRGPVHCVQVFGLVLESHCDMYRQVHWAVRCVLGHYIQLYCVKHISLDYHIQILVSCNILS